MRKLNKNKDFAKHLGKGPGMSAYQEYLPESIEQAVKRQGISKTMKQVRTVANRSPKYLYDIHGNVSNTRFTAQGQPKITDFLIKPQEIRNINIWNPEKLKATFTSNTQKVIQSIKG